MSRIFPLLATVAALAPAVLAADAPLTQEIHELRRDVQSQAKKIEALSEQILRLTQVVEGAKAPAAEIAKPVAPEPEVPKAEAVLPSVKHTVGKGETLTSIAKHYNIPLSDLQKLNKITNDRKLQIGQTLIVPAGKPPESKAPEAPANKEQTP